MAVVVIEQVVILPNPVAVKGAIKIQVRVGEYALHENQLPFKLGGQKNGIKN